MAATERTEGAPAEIDAGVAPTELMSGGLQVADGVTVICEESAFEPQLFETRTKYVVADVGLTVIGLPMPTSVAPPVERTWNQENVRPEPPLAVALSVYPPETWIAVGVPTVIDGQVPLTVTVAVLLLTVVPQAVTATQ